MNYENSHNYENSRPRIYIGDLSRLAKTESAKYGGIWINADRPVEEIQADIDRLLSGKVEYDFLTCNALTIEKMNQILPRRWAILDWEFLLNLDSKDPSMMSLEEISKFAIDADTESAT